MRQIIGIEISFCQSYLNRDTKIIKIILKCQCHGRPPIARMHIVYPVNIEQNLVLHLTYSYFSAKFHIL